MTFFCSNGKWTRGDGKEIPTAPMQPSYRDNVPMEIAAEAYKEYEAQGHGSQSLARLNERGGFCASEMAILLYERIKRLEKQLPRA